MQGHPPNGRLDSWKEIASFVGRDVRTVQRWEREGLPVYRRAGTRRSGVVAYEHELEAWLAGRIAVEHIPDTPDTAARTQTRGFSGRFLAAAACLAIAVAALALLAARTVDRPEATTAWRTVAITSSLLRAPRWADVDGDERGDIIVGAADKTTLIFRDAATRVCGTDAVTCADIRIHLPPPCATQHAQPADFNGDGVDDLMVSCLLTEPESLTATGATYLVFGRREWPRELWMPADADVRITTPRPHDDRTHGCLNGGLRTDVNGDGVADVVLGSTESPFTGRLSAGALYVFNGRRTWPAAVSIADADVTIGGSRMGEGLGVPCALGDFDGDGRSDIAVHATEAQLWNLLGGVGRTYLIHGRESWPRVIDVASEPVMRFDGAPAGNGAPQIALADLDGDGRDDLAFAVPTTRDPHGGSRVALWRGRSFTPMASALAGADAVLHGAASDSRFGASLAGSDLDMDGTQELLAADPGAGSIAAVTASSDARFRASRAASYPAAERTTAAFNALAARNGALVLATARRSRWHLEVSLPFAPIAIDVRPYSVDDLIVRPGVAAIGFPSAGHAREIDPTSLRAAGARPMAHARIDIDGDSISDLVAYFRTEQMNLSAGAKSLTVVGRTRAGIYVRGESPVRVVTVTAERQ